MFRTLICPSSGACDCVVELPHWSFCYQFVVLEIWCGWVWVVPVLQAGTTQTHPHQISNTQRTENKTTDVVIQQHSRKLLMMDMLMSETCWVHKKWNKIASDIKLVFYSPTITMMHGPINIRLQVVFDCNFTYICDPIQHKGIAQLKPSKSVTKETAHSFMVDIMELSTAQTM